MNDSATSDTADQCVPSAPATSSFDDTKNSLKRKAPDDDDDDDDDTCTCEWAACDEQFSTLDDLAPHLFRNHLNNRRSIDFHCRWGSCTVSVDGSEELLSHLTNHLGQRLIHGCRWLNCNRRFASFDELTGHLSEEHVGAGQSKYSCLWERCDRQGKVFTQRQKVMRHIQTHTGKCVIFFIDASRHTHAHLHMHPWTHFLSLLGDKPYECTICRKRFSESNIMTQHMRTHTGEKPYKCPESGCNRQFSISGALTIHRRVHSGERPFSCKYDGCDKRFAESSNLTKHVCNLPFSLPFFFPYLTMELFYIDAGPYW